jgi:hypothetical protein
MLDFYPVVELAEALYMSEVIKLIDEGSNTF